MTDVKKITGGKKKKPPREFWRDWISMFFDFCRDKFGEDPSFDGASPRYMGMIYDAMQKKCKKKNIEWTQDISTRSFKLFLKIAWADPYRQKRFNLSMLNAQKDAIFFEIKNFKENGGSQNNQGFNSVNNRGDQKLGTSDARIKRAKDW